MHSQNDILRRDNYFWSIKSGIKSLLTNGHFILRLTTCLGTRKQSENDVFDIWYIYMVLQNKLLIEFRAITDLIYLRHCRSINNIKKGLEALQLMQRFIY